MAVSDVKLECQTWWIEQQTDKWDKPHNSTNKLTDKTVEQEREDIAMCVVNNMKIKNKTKIKTKNKTKQKRLDLQYPIGILF